MNAANARIGTGNARVHLFARGVHFGAAPVRVVEVRKHGHVRSPGRYVGAEAQEDDGEPFEQKMQRLTATLREQQAEAAKLDAAIAANLKELGYGG
jgi:hypothetical protein